MTTDVDRTAPLPLLPETAIAHVASAAPPREGWARRLWSGKVARLLARNTVVSCCVFVFDLALLWAMVEWGGMDKLVAAAIGFVAANSIHYLFGRAWIFEGTERAFASGYLYFFVNAGVGLVVTILLFDLFMLLLGSHYIAARVIASVFAGLTVFLLNAVLNFKSV